MSVLPVVVLAVIAWMLRSPIAILLVAIGAAAAIRLLISTAVQARVDTDRRELRWDTVTGSHAAAVDSLTRVRPAPLNRTFLLVDGDGVRVRIPPAPGIAGVVDELSRLRPDLSVATSAQIRQLIELDRDRQS